MKAVLNHIADAETRASADRATTLLRTAIGPDADVATATWTDKADAKNRAVIELRLEDSPGVATALFAPPELSQSERRHNRFRVIWGDLLRDRTHHFARKLQDLEWVAE